MALTVSMPCLACGKLTALTVGDPKPHCTHCKAVMPPVEEVASPAVDDHETAELQAEPQGKPRTPQSNDRRGGSRIGLGVDELEVVPRRLGNYELVEIIGRGGMGLVYRARQVDLDRTVALKLIRTPHPRQEDALRFVVEAQVTGQIEHPNIVPVHEMGTDEKGRPFFVMKLVRGEALSEILMRLRKGDSKTRLAYPLTRLLHIFCEVCQAIAFAHAKGVLHRDIKPSNVMIGDFGEVLVMDWGLARKFGEPDTKSAGLLTVTPGSKPVLVAARGEMVRTVREDDTLAAQGLVAGTPEYMSPEQAAGDVSAMHPRSDVYSLGALLFEILNYRPPHVDPDTRVLVRKVATEPVIFPRHGGNRPKITPALRAVCLKALAMNPDERYAGALGLLIDVRAILADEPVSAKPDTPADKLARLFRRHGMVLATFAAAIVLLSLGAAASSWVLKAAAQQREFEKSQRLHEAEQREQAEGRARLEAEARVKAVKDRAEAVEARRLAEAQNIESANRLARAIPLFLDALELLKRRRHDAALAQLQLVIEADPGSPVAALAHFACGEALQAKGSPEAARQAIAQYLAADAVSLQVNKIGDPRAVMRSGEVALRMLNDTVLALKYFERAAAIDPANPYGMLGLAYARILRGRGADAPETRQRHAREALALALKAVEHGGYLWEAHYVAGTLYGGLELPGTGVEDLAKAPQHLSQALALEPGAADLWLSRARVLRAIGDKTAALSDLGTYLRQRPDAVEALAARAELFMDIDRPAEALADAQRLLAQNARNPSGLLVRAAALSALKRPPEAEAAWGEALAVLAKDPALWLRRAKLRYLMGRFAEAAEDAGQALALDDKHLEALRLRADARIKAGRPVEAAEDYKLLRERDPAQTDVLLGLGDALRMQGRGADALEAFRAFVKLQPDRLDVRVRIVQMLCTQRDAAWYDPAAAIREARDAQQLAQNRDPKVMLALADALLAGNKGKEALEIVEKAYSNFPTDPEVVASRERMRHALETRPVPRP